MVIVALLVALDGRAEATTVVITPDQPIEAAVEHSPPGTIFLVRRGTYRLQQVEPKDGDSFTGEPGTVLSGAKLLTRFRKSGRIWIASDPSAQGQGGGYCAPTRPACTYSENLFVDDRPLRHAASREEVGPGSYYFDYAAHEVLLGTDPAGKKIELGIARVAFFGPAQGVTIKGLTIEKYAIPAQMGAIGDQAGVVKWTIENNVIRWNHGAGVRANSGTRVIGNEIYGNGQLGLSASGDDVLIEGNEIADNNYAGFDPGWEAGGAKFSGTTSLMVRNNFSHGNFGPGLWTDINNYRTTYEYNTVTDNAWEGIQHEISYDALIHGNIVNGNGNVRDNWVWGAQILIQNSRNVDVSDNYVELETRGDGIAIVSQNRGAGSRGKWEAVDNRVHDNHIIIGPNFQREGSDAGVTGVAGDYDVAALLQTNAFDHDHYYVPDPNGAWWRWAQQTDWRGLRGQGQEAHGTMQSDSHPPAPPRPSLSLSASPAPVIGHPFAITWSARLATTCQAFGGWTGVKPLAGSLTLVPHAPATYGIVCHGVGGEATKTISVEAGL
ncbi:MAG TPA: right-handed parallel beta-helix repeat-containing protein [Stellaceae bacterium]|nr:right-handed parallel beta-helix repeat-containing protein [Stellaceae bacterium]